MDILLKTILIVVLITTPIVTAEYNYEEVRTIIYEAGVEVKPGLTEDLVWYVGDEEHSGVVGFWENGRLTAEMKTLDYWDTDDPMIMMTGETTDQFGFTISYASFTAPTPGGDQVYVDITGYDIPLSEIEPVADSILLRLIEESAASGAISVSVNTIYIESEIYGEVVEAIKDIRPGFNDDGYWYVGDDEHAGVVAYSELVLGPEMKNPDYWNINERMMMSENPDMIISSDITFDAPTPYGTRVYVTVDGYNVPLSEIQPVAEVIYNTLVERSFESGAIGDGVAGDTVTQDASIGTSIGAIESDSLQDTIPDDIPTVTDNGVESDEDSTDDDNLEDKLAEIDELFSLYDELLEKGLLEYEKEMDVDYIGKQDIEDLQNIQMNYILPEEFVESIQEQAIIIDMLRSESSEDIDKLDEIDTDEEQDIETNRAIIKDVFGNDFNFDAGSSVSVGSGPEYEGKEKVAEKLSENLYLDALDNTRKESMEKLKTGHEAASFFLDSYGDSKIAKNFEKIDKINSFKEEIDKYYGAYKDTKKLSEMKGASGTSAKALYALAKSGQEVADKIPVVGDLIKTELEAVEKIVMVIPELDDAINSGARQGVITNGPIGTSTPNAFLSSYGKVTQTDDGPSYSLPYTDENGEEHEISPDQWVKVTTKTGTYYIPTDEWENPIGDIALKDSGSSWKPWKWDNCQIVKRSNPGITYNNGEEYDL
ncbi:hypothetical protein RE474_00935 [Methanolobus sediminis]|uniref:Uncharacterized protein n=1 Tax=Methanolobus sediminis TaxID=3072978 RepID=A0AA51YJ86_9EURY|nr:hypothetical protein [Methanolobus sediminis]WMW25315.1 hypothetical protein RE474_00935 [Methanolobus sediminis]